MPNSFMRMVLIALISIALVKPARAESIDTAGKQLEVGIVVVGAALVVGVTLLILHEKHKKATITGCVQSGANGTSVTDEKDQQIYLLSGDPAGIKAGDRMTVAGNRKAGGKGSVFEVHGVIKDFGVCRP